MARKRTRRCRFGKVKSGPRKGRCRKRKLSGAAARASRGGARRSTKRGARRCRFGVVKVGKRKGQCLKNKRAKRRR